MAPALPVVVRLRESRRPAVTVDVERTTSTAFHHIFAAATESWKDPGLHSSTLALLSDFVRIHGHGRVVNEAERVIRQPSLLPVRRGKPTELLARKTLVRVFGDLNDSRFLGFMLKHGLMHGDASLRALTLEKLRSMGTGAAPALELIHRHTATGVEPNAAVRNAAQLAHRTILSAWKDFICLESRALS